MSRRHDDERVPVPDLLGLTVLEGHRRMGSAKLALARATDGQPPLGAAVWQHGSEYVVTSQSPPPGYLVEPYSNVLITLQKDQEPEGPVVREPLRPKTPSGAPGQVLPLAPDSRPESVDR